MKEFISKILNIIGQNESLKIGNLPILNLIMKGGWIMLPIIMLSLISIYIIIYKLIEFANTTKYSDQWLKNLRKKYGRKSRDRRSS